MTHSINIINTLLPADSCIVFTHPFGVCQIPWGLVAAASYHPVATMAFQVVAAIPPEQPWCHRGGIQHRFGDQLDDRQAERELVLSWKIQAMDG